MVETDQPGPEHPVRARPTRLRAIAEHAAGLPGHEVGTGRCRELLPLQSGVGNVANAVLAGLDWTASSTDLTAFTEVIQDGMLDLLDSGKLTSARRRRFGSRRTARRFLEADVELPAAGSSCAARRSPTIPS